MMLFALKGVRTACDTNLPSDLMDGRPELFLCKFENYGYRNTDSRPQGVKEG